MPKPRNESVATVKIAYPSRTVNSTITGGRTLGRISTNRMYGGALAAQTRRGDVLELTLGQDGRADSPRDQRREDEADDDDHGVVRGPESGQREERDDHDREGEEGLDDPRDRLVDEPPEVAHHEPERRAGHGSEDGGQEGHHDDVPRADEHAGEDVSAEAVGTEPVIRRRGLQGLDGARLERIVGGDHVAEDRAEDPEADDEDAGEERLRAQERAERLAPGPA